MKKLLGSTLALALFLPAGANAELLKNFKIGGQLDVQTTSARNTADFVTHANALAGGSGPGAASPNNDRLGSAFTRVMLKMDWDLLDDVHSRVTLVKGTNSQGTLRPYGNNQESVQTLQNNTFVEEAFVKIDKLFGFTDLTLGRQFYGEPGDLVIYYGPRDNYGLNVDGLDAGRFDWNGEHWTLTGIVGKLPTNLGAVTATAPRDQDIRGLVASCNKNENMKGSAYVYNAVVHKNQALGSSPNEPWTGADGKNTFLWVAGIKSKMTFGGLMAAIELAKNFGQDRTTYVGTGQPNDYVNYTGYAVKLNLAYKAEVADVGMFAPFGEFAKGTGDNNFSHAGNRNFQDINSDYRPGGLYGRFDSASAAPLGSGVSATIASNGLSNRVVWGAGVKLTPAAFNKLTTGVQFFRYAFDRLPTNAGANPIRFSRNIGSEIDVTGEWKHSENVSVKGTLGTFKPGAYVADLKAGGGLNPAVMAAADFSVKF